MDTQAFFNDLKEHAGSVKKPQEKSNEFFDYVDLHYEEYIYATPEERAEIRKFIRGKFFQPKQVAYALLIYVKERALQNLKSTRDKVWLIRGLVAISMENHTTSFVDTAYNPSDMKTDDNYLLADLYVSAEENGIDPKLVIEDYLKISGDSRSFEPTGKLYYERKRHGKFIGIGW